MLKKLEIQNEEYVFRRGDHLWGSHGLMRTYDELESILSKHGNGLVPTVKQTLLYSPLKDDSLCWTSTKNLYTPEGIIVYDDAENKMPSDAESLLKLHKDGDPAVRFAKWGFHQGYQDISDFVKNPFVIAQIGDKDSMGIVAKRAQRMNPKHAYVVIMSLDQHRLGQGPVERISGPTLLDSYGICREGLHIYADKIDDKYASIYGYMENAAKSQ